MASKTSRTTNFSEQEKLLLAELGRDFPEVEGKGYDNKTLTKKAKAWAEILTRFNSKILMVSNATSVSFKDAGGGWNSSRKRSMTYNVVKQEKLVEEKLSMRGK